jgi:surface protein
MSKLFSNFVDFNEDLSKWQTGNVTDMTFMFNGASSFTSDLSEWQTGKVRDMSEMFDGAGSLQQRPPWYTCLQT